MIPEVIKFLNNTVSEYHHSTPQQLFLKLAGMDYWNRKLHEMVEEANNVIKDSSSIAARVSNTKKKEIEGE